MKGRAEVFPVAMHNGLASPEAHVRMYAQSLPIIVNTIILKAKERRSQRLASATQPSCQLRTEVPIPGLNVQTTRTVA